MTYRPMKNGALCKACPRKGQPFVPPEGRPGAAVVWLGQEPSAQEVKQERPFVGPTGTRLTHLWEAACELLKVRIPRTSIWITNGTLCPSVTNGDKEARLAAKCCRPRLMRELAACSPKAAILVMGKWAAFSLFGTERGVGELHGFHLKLRQPRGSKTPEDLRR